MEFPGNQTLLEGHKKFFPFLLLLPFITTPTVATAVAVAALNPHHTSPQSLDAAASHSVQKREIQLTEELEHLINSTVHNIEGLLHPQPMDLLWATTKPENLSTSKENVTLPIEVNHTTQEDQLQTRLHQLSDFAFCCLILAVIALAVALFGCISQKLQEPSIRLRNPPVPRIIRIPRLPVPEDHIYETVG